MSTETTTPEVRAERMQSELNQRRAIAKHVCASCRPDFLRWGLIDHEDWAYEACDTELCRGCHAYWPECAMVDKIQGRRCPLCAHELELHLLGAAGDVHRNQDPQGCQLCRISLDDLRQEIKPTRFAAAVDT